MQFDRFGVKVASQAETRAAVLAACGIAEMTPAVSGQVAIGFACSDLAFERMLTPAQWIEVFRDNVRPDRLVPGDMSNISSIVFRIKCADLAAFSRPSRISLLDAALGAVRVPAMGRNQRGDQRLRRRSGSINSAFNRAPTSVKRLSAAVSLENRRPVGP